MDPLKTLAGIPARLREELLHAFAKIMRNYRESRWEPSELNGGKLCEVVYTILRGHVDGSMLHKATKPPNMFAGCIALESADASRFSRSIRIQIPRMLIALYEIRNNRGVGHVGGDIDPNHMDSKVVVEMSKWIMAELIRVFHGLDTDQASQVVEKLIERTVPVVWVTGDKPGEKRRVLNPAFSHKDQMLVLLFSANGPVNEADLLSWAEHTNPAVYRRDILRRAHKDRLIEYDETNRQVQISPTGIAYVEDNLPLQI